MHTFIIPTGGPQQRLQNWDIDKNILLNSVFLFEENKMSQNYFHDLVGNRYLMVKTQFTLMTTTI